MKIICISLGDPAGIGPEILVKSYFAIDRVRSAVPLVVGDLSVIEKNLKFASKVFNINVVKAPQNFKKGVLNVYSPGIIKDRGFPIGKDSRINGNASFCYVSEAIKLWQEGLVNAIVTLPISKNAWHKAGHYYSGHTELLAERLGVKKYAMIMLAGKLRVLLVTTHIALKDVAKELTVSLIVGKVFTAYEFLTGAGVKSPVVGMSALNPHSGENGIIGKEEKEIIEPAVRIIRKKGISCTGPLPADAIFKKAIDGELDMVAAMYHDQGMIPLKTFYFNKLVNCTAGLGMVRTSPGHGTGFDIAYKGKANPSAFIEAYKVAAQLLNSSTSPTL